MRQQPVTSIQQQVTHNLAWADVWLKRTKAGNYREALPHLLAVRALLDRLYETRAIRSC